MYLDYHTDDWERYAQMPDESETDPWMGSERSLALYISGKGEWDRCLRVWFDREDF